MAKMKVLISVKTYPTVSTKYDELVCTAGFDEDGNWIRIYPIPFRKLDYINRYSKYEWVEMDLVKNTRDFRPESYRPVDIEIDDLITFHGKIDTRNNWAERKKYALNKVYTNIATLIKEAKDKTICTSLATYKPTEILDFVYEEEKNREWSEKQIATLKQQHLFQEKSEFSVVKKLPYKFSYVFRDDDGTKRKLMNEDWEVGALYWNGINKFGDEKMACEYVREQYFDNFVASKDLYFFLGTTQAFHFRGVNPFIIIGVFYPKKEKPQPQLSLDF